MGHNTSVEFTRLFELVGDELIFETALLLARDVNLDHVRRQLRHWTQARRLYLRHGLYAPARTPARSNI
jgi:hypothetical protein